MAKCSATTNAGKPCRANALHGGDKCLAHADAKVRESVGFIADNGKAGRTPVPRHTEVARKLVEENVIAVQRPYWRALGYDVVIGENGPHLVDIDEGGAKLHGTHQKSGQIVMSEHDDIGAMMDAAERLQNRAFGKPKQVSEISGPDSGPVEFAGLPTADDWHAAVASVLSETGAHGADPHQDE